MDELFDYTCTIRRATKEATKSGEDRHTWSDNQTGVECRLWRMSSKERFDQALDELVSHRLYFAYGTDVLQADQIADVVGPDGTTLITLADIEGVNVDPGGQQHHVEVDLIEVKTI